MFSATRAFLKSSFRWRALSAALAACVYASCFSGCAVGRKVTNNPVVGGIGSGLSAVTNTVKKTGRKLYSSTGKTGTAMSKDVSKFTTKLPGTRSQNVSERDLRAIDDFRRAQAYKRSIKPYSSKNMRGVRVQTYP